MRVERLDRRNQTFIKIYKSTMNCEGYIVVSDREYSRNQDAIELNIAWDNEFILINRIKKKIIYSNSSDLRLHCVAAEFLK